MFVEVQNVPCVDLLLVREREWAVFELAQTVVVPNLDECPDEKRGGLRRFHEHQWEVCWQSLLTFSLSTIGFPYAVVSSILKMVALRRFRGKIEVQVALVPTARVHLSLDL